MTIHRITLEIRVPDDGTTLPPQRWDWPTLLDLPDRDDVKVFSWETRPPDEDTALPSPTGPPACPECGAAPKLLVRRYVGEESFPVLGVDEKGDHAVLASWERWDDAYDDIIETYLSCENFHAFAHGTRHTLIDPDAWYRNRLERIERIEHLRTAHGYADDEPGGRNHIPGVTGLTHRLDEMSDDVLDALHDQDHGDYLDEGTPVKGEEHTHKREDA